jgi:peptidoglycan hydrolase FlgJ
MASIAPLASPTAPAAKLFPLPGKPESTLPISGKPEIGSLGAPAGTRTKPDAAAKARANAVDFESMFLNSMFSQMFTGIDGEGPFGGGGAGGVWRSFLTEQYAKTFAKAGGIGIADHVYRSLMAQQEARAQ